MRRFLPLLLLAIAPVQAAEEAGAVKGGQAGTNLDLPYLMAPLTNSAGKLTGYAYISSRLTAASESGITAVRTKLPFIQDVFVRDVNGRGVTLAADPEQVDIAGVESRLLADAMKILGPGKVKMITVCTVQIAELHADKTPALKGPDEPKPVDGHGNPQKTRCTTEKPG